MVRVETRAVVGVYALDEILDEVLVANGERARRGLPAMSTAAGEFRRGLARTPGAALSDCLPSDVRQIEIATVKHFGQQRLALLARGLLVHTPPRVNSLGGAHSKPSEFGKVAGEQLPIMHDGHDLDLLAFNTEDQAKRSFQEFTDISRILRQPPPQKR